MAVKKGIEDSVLRTMQPDAYVLKSVWTIIKELKVDIPQNLAVQFF